MRRSHCASAIAGSLATHRSDAAGRERITIHAAFAPYRRCRKTERLQASIKRRLMAEKTSTVGMYMPGIAENAEALIEDLIKGLRRGTS